MADSRREQLAAAARAVADLATHRQIEAQHVSKVVHDREFRKVLAAIVRRWPNDGVSWTTTAALTALPSQTHVEHVVPVRVIVDRMIMNPQECSSLLESIPLARVTRDEHLRLGGIFSDHAEIYDKMLKSTVSGLPQLGIERYVRSHIDLFPVS